MVLSPLLLAGVRTTVCEIESPMGPSDLPVMNTVVQQGHAFELSQRGPASVAPQSDIRRAIYLAVKANLPKKYSKRAFEISRAIINEANHHKMDPFFLMAVIKTESHFNIKARGRHGEIGLMQIMPQTGKWIASQAGLNANHINLEDPATNIRIGATYFASLRKEFNGSTAQYIGAYNMGPANVRKLAGMAIEPTVYPGKVLKNYNGFYTNFSKYMPNISNTAQKAKQAPKLESRAIPSKKLDKRMLNLMRGWETA